MTAKLYTHGDVFAHIFTGTAKPRILGSQGGCEVTLIEPDLVLKWGRSVRHNESVALRLVRKHARDVPVPRYYRSWFGLSDGLRMGHIYMSFVQGERLDRVWDHFSDATKERVCNDIWDLVERIRMVPRPRYLDTCLYSTVDGSPTLDPLLGGERNRAPPLYDDEALRNCITTRYVDYAGKEDIASLLPRSDTAVFTHGDIAPRNIIVDRSGKIRGLLDWESAGWYPDYWEFARMMMGEGDKDWMGWMRRTVPQDWDISGIEKARDVLL